MTKRSVPHGGAKEAGDLTSGLLSGLAIIICGGVAVMLGSVPGYIGFLLVALALHPKPSQRPVRFVVRPVEPAAAAQAPEVPAAPAEERLAA